jgi:hypothetical protein
MSGYFTVPGSGMPRYCSTTVYIYGQTAITSTSTVIGPSTIQLPVECTGTCTQLNRIALAKVFIRERANADPAS